MDSANNGNMVPYQNPVPQNAQNMQNAQPQYQQPAQQSVGPNFIINFSSSNPNVYMVYRIDILMSKAIVRSGQSIGFILPMGNYPVVLKIGNINYSRTVCITGNNSVIANCSWFGKAAINMFQSNESVNMPIGNVVFGYFMPRNAYAYSAQPFGYGAPYSPGPVYYNNPNQMHIYGTPPTQQPAYAQYQYQNQNMYSYAQVNQQPNYPQLQQNPYNYQQSTGQQYTYPQSDMQANAQPEMQTDMQPEMMTNVQADMQNNAQAPVNTQAPFDASNAVEGEYSEVSPVQERTAPVTEYAQPPMQDTNMNFNPEMNQ